MALRSPGREYSFYYPIANQAGEYVEFSTAAVLRYARTDMNQCILLCAIERHSGEHQQLSIFSKHSMEP